MGDAPDEIQGAARGAEILPAMRERLINLVALTIIAVVAAYALGRLFGE